MQPERLSYRRGGAAATERQRVGPRTSRRPRPGGSGVAAKGNADPMERGLGVAVDRAGRRQDLGEQLPSPLDDGVPDLAPGVRDRDSRDAAVAIVLVGNYEPSSGQAAHQP